MKAWNVHRDKILLGQVFAKTASTAVKKAIKRFGEDIKCTRAAHISWG